MTKNLLSLIFLSFIVGANNIDKPNAYNLPNQYIKKISLQTLTSKSTSVQIPMLNKKMASFSIHNKKTYLNGDFSFESKTSDSKGYISATVGKNSVFGQMHYDNKHYILTTEKSGSWLIELPENGMTYNNCGFKGHKHQPLPNKTNLKTAKTKDAGQYTVIDLLFVYNQALADRYPGDLLQTRFNQYLNVANQATENSKIFIKFRNVASEQIAYDLNNDNATAIYAMSNSLMGNTVAGMENLKQLRETNGADIVVFFRPHDIEKRGACGVAFYPILVDVGEFDSNYGVQVVSDGMDSWSICTDEVMIHELGHNLGAAHHNAPIEQRFRDDAAGFAKIGQFTTIMGSFGTGRPERFYELRMFSNPNLQCGGETCGSYEGFNNASVIKTMKTFVADYQEDHSSVPIPETLDKIDADHDGDGFADSVDAFPFDSLQHSDADKDGVSDVNDAFPNNASEQLDTDNDGIGNNQDSDDDGDGTDDLMDYYPLDQTEIKDTDQDGKADNSDAFPTNDLEWNDFDHDLIGDNLDTDDDNDGFEDSELNKQDLLIISIGNNRILRFDAETGEPKGIEVISNDGQLTFQSDLTYNKEEQRLFYTSASAVKSIELNRTALGVIIPPFAKNQIQSMYGISLESGFPTSLLSLSDNRSKSLLIVSVLNNSFLRSYVGANKKHSINIFTTNEIKNIIDITKKDNVLYYLDQSPILLYGANIYNPVVLNTNSQNWAKDPFAIAVSSDDRLFITNQESNKIESINSVSGVYLGTFADISTQGYSNPTGIAISDDNIMLIAASDQNAILKFNVATGDFLGELVAGHGLDQPHKMILVPQLNDRFPHDAQKVIRPNAGLWYNPETSGRGFDIQVFNNSLSVIWYTFDEQGLPTWYISSGELNGFEYTGTFQKTHLNPDASVTVKDAGSININFNSERQALINWEIGTNQGTEEIKWLVWSYDEEASNYTGLWGRPDGPGWGTTVATIGKTSIAVPYIYDANGEPRWLISDPVTTGSPLNFNLNTVFSDTLCPSCTGVSSFTTKSAGTMVLDLSGDKNWNSSLQFPAPLIGDWLLNDTEIKLFSSEATRSR